MNGPSPTQLRPLAATGFAKSPDAYERGRPEYPEEATSGNIEGTVLVKVIVGADGTVENATVLKSSNTVFEAPALDAALQSKFKPAKLEGKPTKSQVAVPYQFRLDC